MFCQIKGKCLFIGEPRQITSPGRPPRTMREFHFLVEVPKQAPEIVKAVSFNGFAPKLNEPCEFSARVSAREYKGRGLLNIEVL
jgi:hypothetical protein